MVPAELGAFERGYTEYDENRESYHLLYHLQLDQGKWAASKPILLAGTWKQYSTRAMPHERPIMRYSGQLFDTPDVCSFRWPYHAKVMNTLAITSMAMVNRAVFIISRI